jgi:Tol biopolymer transport system component
VFVLAAAFATNPAQAVRLGRDGKIAFTAFNVDTGSYDISVVDPAGGDAVDVTPDAAASDEAEPSWSPAARRIAFTSDRGDGSASFVYLMNADGGAVRKVGGGGFEQRSPAWSPDGRWIAFSRCTALLENGECSSAQIAVISPDGKGFRQVTKPLRGIAASDAKPAWSPNGAQIVFTRTRSFGLNEIWAVGANGKGLRRLLHDDSESDHNPSWSPDGKQIAFASDAAGTDAIWVMKANGTGVQKLVDEFTDPDDPDATIGGGAVNPAFSPSGKGIVFSAGGDVWRVDRAGANPVLVAASGDDPDWGRAG